MNYQGEAFINKIYNDLINDYAVQHSGKANNKNEQLILYFERLENITKYAYNNNKIELLKDLYYEKYVIKPENVPERHFQNQERIALERGFGHIKFNNDIKQKEINSIIKEQKESLDRWIDYFASDDSKQYPTWFKYYCFQGVIRIGYLDKKNNKFTKRTSDTVKPFIEINYEAIAYLYDVLVKSFNKIDISDNELEQLVKGGSFAKIYFYILIKLDSINKDTTRLDDGIWKKYLRNSDENILFNDIHGKGTGWCTAGGLETTKAHLNRGDFYVYYTKDKDNNYTIPRIAIRMNYRNIGEIRGIGPNQNLEPNMLKVVNEKLEEFPDKDEYLKKVHDMNYLTDIYNRIQNNDNDLSSDDLKFLYEIDEKICGFGYSKDPRIDEILNKRDKISDIAQIFNCSKDEISFTVEEALEGNKKLHYGNLDIPAIVKRDYICLPKIVYGSLRIKTISLVSCLIMPDIVKGNIFIGDVYKHDKIVFPKYLNTEIYIYSRIYKTLNNIIFPEELKGSIYINALNIENVIYPKDLSGKLAIENKKNDSFSKFIKM